MSKYFLLILLFISSVCFSQNFVVTFFATRAIPSAPLDPIEPIVVDWTEKPTTFQLFARDNNDSGTVTMSGVLQSTGYDSVKTKVYRNGSLVKTNTSPLTYTGSSANFSINSRIKAELFEYTVELIFKTNLNKDSLEFTVDSLVAGDVYVGMGQSYGFYTRLDPTFTPPNQYVRTFGIVPALYGWNNYNAADTLWHHSNSYYDYSGATPNTPYNTSGLGNNLQIMIKNAYSVPTAYIMCNRNNSSIRSWTPNYADTNDVTTYFGSTLYRVQKAKLVGKVKAVIWNQGQSDCNTAPINLVSSGNPRGQGAYYQYGDYFDTVYNAIKLWIDPENIIVAQFGFSPAVGNWQPQMREQLRQIGNRYADVHMYTEIGLGPGVYSGDAHPSLTGFTKMATNLFGQLGYLYYAPSTNLAAPPNLTHAFFKDSTKKIIGMTFDGTGINAIPADTLGLSIKNQFFIDKVRINADSLTLNTTKDTLYLHTSFSQSGTRLRYLDSSNSYIAPVLRNSLGVACMSFDSVLIEDPFTVTLTDTARWKDDTKSLLAQMYDSASFPTLEKKWILDSLIAGLQADGQWSGWDAFFVTAWLDAPSAKINWIRTDSNYFLSEDGYTNISPNTPTHYKYRGFLNSATDSVWLTTNIYPARLFNYRKDSGTVMAYSGDQYAIETFTNVNPPQNGIGKIYGVYRDSINARSLHLSPFGKLSGVDYGFGQVGNDWLSFASNFSGNTSSKGLYTLSHIKTGTSINDSTIFYRNDSIKQKIQNLLPYFYIDREIYLGACNFDDSYAADFFPGRITFFAIGKKRSYADVQKIYARLEHFMLRIGASYTQEELEAPTLTYPTNNATGISLSPILNWNDLSGATEYNLQVSTISDFSSTVENVEALTVSNYTTTPLSTLTKYYWRVQGVNNSGPGPWATDSFTTGSVFTADTTNWQLETKDYFSRIYAKGSFPGLDLKWQYDSLIKDLVTDTLFSSCWDAGFIFPTFDTTMANTSLINNTYSVWGSGPNNIAPNKPTFTQYRGYKNPKADSVYLFSNIVPSGLSKYTKDSGSAISYVIEAKSPIDTFGTPPYGGRMFGTIDTVLNTAITNDNFTYYSAGLGYISIGQLNSIIAVYKTNILSTSNKGLYAIIRTSPTSISGYRNDTLMYTTTAASTAPITIPMMIGAQNFNNGVAQFYFHGRYGIFFIGKKLTAAREQKLFNHIQKFLVKIGASYTSLLPPTLSSPTNNQTGVVPSPVMDWSDVTGVSSYSLQIAKTPRFDSLVLDITGLGSSTYSVTTPLDSSVKYFWRVRAKGTDQSSWSTNSFTVISSTGVIPDAPSITFTNKPTTLQLYARDSEDSATVPISGVLSTTGYDSIYVEVYKAGVLSQRKAQGLSDSSSLYPFYLLPKIHSELSEYSFKIYTKYSITPVLVTTVDSVVAGDMFIIAGQSNGQNPNDSITTYNEYIRTFGIQTNSMNLNTYSAGDTLWHRASAQYSDFSVGGSTTKNAPYNVGALGMYLQNYIKDSCQVPTAIINETHWGTSIITHQRNNSSPTDFTTYYGKALYRAQKSGLASKIKAIIWYQGEMDVNGTSGTSTENPKGVSGYSTYLNKFDSLKVSWLTDYPGLEKIYVIQVRPLNCAGSSTFAQELREYQRRLQQLYPGLVQVVSSNGIGGYQLCHYDKRGYLQLAQVLLKNFGKDFYPGKLVDTTDSRPPDINSAFYINSSKIGITFKYSKPVGIPADSVIGGNTVSIKKYFYLDDVRTSSNVNSLTLNSTKDTMYIWLNTPSTATRLGYLPNYLNEYSATYTGPFIRNSRGLGLLSFDSVTISSAPDYAYETESESYFSRAITNGSSGLNTNHKQIIDSLVKYLKNNSMFTGDGLYIYGNQDTGAALTNILNSSYTGSRRGTALATFIADSGFRFTYTNSSYIKMNMIPGSLSSFKQDSGTIAVYNSSFSPHTFGSSPEFRMIGATNGSSYLGFIPVSYYSGGYKFFTNMNDVSTSTILNSYKYKGLVLVTRLDTGRVRGYVNGEFVYSNIGRQYPVTINNTREIVVGAYNSNGTIKYFYNGLLRGAYIGGKMDGDKVNKFTYIMDWTLKRMTGDTTANFKYPVRDANPILRHSDTLYIWNQFNALEYPYHTDSIRMFYKRFYPGQSYSMTSVDGINWNNHKAITLNTGGYLDQGVIRIPGTDSLRGFTHSLDAETNTYYRYQLAKSSNDGYNWTMFGDTLFFGAKTVANSRVGEDISITWNPDSSRYNIYFRDSTTQDVPGSGYPALSLDSGHQYALRTIAYSSSADLLTYNPRTIIIPKTRANFHNVYSKDYRVVFNNMTVIRTGTNEWFALVNCIQQRVDALENYQPIGGSEDIVRVRLYSSKDGVDWRACNDSNYFLPAPDSIKQQFAQFVAVGDSVFIYTIESPARHTDYPNTTETWRIWRYSMPLEALRKFFIVY